MASLDNFPVKREVNIVWTTDDSFYLSFVAKDKNSNIIDLTGTVPKGQIRAAVGNALLLDFTAGFVNSDPTQGHPFYSLTGTQVATLLGVDAVYDWELDGGDTNRRTLIFGTFAVVSQVTES